jgi:hypothetical protein
MSTKGWSVTDVPDRIDTTAVVTGANRGILEGYAWLGVQRCPCCAGCA